jgi:DNA-binding GntR family transcriptional regulator
MWLPIVSRMMLHYSRHRDMMDSHREHAAIVNAIRQRDKKAAVKALVANIQ